MDDIKLVEMIKLLGCIFPYNFIIRNYVSSEYRLMTRELIFGEDVYCKNNGIVFNGKEASLFIPESEFKYIQYDYLRSKFTFNNTIINKETFGFKDKSITITNDNIDDIKNNILNKLNINKKLHTVNKSNGNIIETYRNKRYEVNFTNNNILRHISIENLSNNNHIFLFKDDIILMDDKSIDLCFLHLPH